MWKFFHSVIHVSYTRGCDSGAQRPFSPLENRRWGMTTEQRCRSIRLVYHYSCIPICLKLHALCYLQEAFARQMVDVCLNDEEGNDKRSFRRLPDQVTSRHVDTHNDLPISTMPKQY